MVVWLAAAALRVKKIRLFLDVFVKAQLTNPSSHSVRILTQYAHHLATDALPPLPSLIF